MCRHWKFQLYVGLALLTCTPSWATEPTKVAQPNEISAQAKTLLGQEASGQAVDRSELASLTTQDDFSKWQAGQVRQGDAWRKLDELEQTPISSKWMEYSRLRESTKLDADGHRQLAKWCAKHNLDAQARAHWTAILDSKPNDLLARMQLGHKLVDGKWFTEDQIAQADIESKELLADLSRWSATCNKIAAGLSSSDIKQKKQALANLRAIHDPAALPAIELACLRSDQSLFEPWIDAISQFRSKKACLALCRIALSNPDSERGQAAIERIREYALEFSVPELLSLLNTPVETKLQFAANENGELFLRRAMFRETPTEKQLIELQRLVRVNDPIAQHVELIQVFSRRFGADVRFPHVSLKKSNQTSTNLIVDELAAAASAMEDQQILDSQIADFNRQNSELADRVYSILEKLTSANSDRTPESWWQWWRSHNYRIQYEKPINYKTYSKVDLAQARLYSAELGRIFFMSCLVAGTEIQTEHGLKNIATLQVGDLVLAQNVETGELDFKPVLRKTLREPATILRIETESGTIRATEGHRWWVPAAAG